MNGLQYVLIQELGGCEAVAELTGRKKRLEPGPGGKFCYVTCPTVPPTDVPLTLA